jgi:tubulin--tyrosine ligase
VLDSEEEDEDEDWYEEEVESKLPKNVWIIKPGENTNCGYGIQVCQTLNEIRGVLKSGVARTYIAQKYIERPLLFNRRKFDIRAYAVMTSVNGCHKGFFFEDGYIRTSSKEYSLNNLSSKFVHLTNDAI